MKKKYAIRTIISIIGFALALYICFILFKPKINDGSLGDYLMADFNIDGKEELLVLSKKYGKEEANILKLIDIESDEVLWKKSIIPTQIQTYYEEPCVVDSVIILKKNFIKNDTINKEQFKCLNIVGVNANTGKQLWEKEIFDNDTLYFHSQLLEKHGNLFICFEQLHKKDRFNHLLKINPLNGETLLKKTIPSDFHFIPPYIGKNKLIYHNSNLILCLDINSGDTTVIYPGKFKYIKDVLIPNEGAFYYMTFKQLFKYDSTQHFLITYNKDRPTTPMDSIFDFDQAVIYDGRLVFLNTHFRFSEAPNYKIHAIPFEERKKGYTYNLEQGFYTATSFCRRVSYLTKGDAGQNVLKTRYIPLQFYKYGSDKKSQDSLDKINPSQIIIFDMEKGEPVWESKIANNVFLSHYKPINDYHYMTFYIPRNDTIERVRLLFNGKNGRFHKAINFSNMKKEYLVRYDKEKISNKYAYFTNEDITWCLSIPELELKYCSKNIDLNDSKAILEETWGKMPWTENN